MNGREAFLSLRNLGDLLGGYGLVAGLGDRHVECSASGVAALFTAQELVSNSRANHATEDDESHEEVADGVVAVAWVADGMNDGQTLHHSEDNDVEKPNAPTLGAERFDDSQESSDGGDGGNPENAAELGVGDLLVVTRGPAPLCGGDGGGAAAVADDINFTAGLEVAVRGPDAMVHFVEAVMGEHRRGKSVCQHDGAVQHHDLGQRFTLDRHFRLDSDSSRSVGLHEKQTKKVS